MNERESQEHAHVAARGTSVASRASEEAERPVAGIASMELDALLPCPFCGGPVYLERATDTYGYVHGRRQWWGVVCRNTINVGGSCAIHQIPSASKEAAIKRWNRRPIQPQGAVSPQGTMLDAEAAKPSSSSGPDVPASAALAASLPALLLQAVEALEEVNRVLHPESLEHEKTKTVAAALRQRIGRE